MWQLCFRAVWISQNHRVNRPCPNSDVLPHEKAARLPLTVPMANLWIEEQNLSSGQVWQPPAVAQRVETLQIIKFISKKLVLLYMFHEWRKWTTSRFVPSAPVFGCICKLHLLAILLLINAPFRKGEISFLLTLPRHDLVTSFCSVRPGMYPVQKAMLAQSSLQLQQTMVWKKCCMSLASQTAYMSGSAVKQRAVFQLYHAEAETSHHFATCWCIFHNAS